MNAKKRAQKGFTLIELVMVIVILGILAAVALPKFVDLSGDAGNAAVKGVAGAISSGSAANYAAKKVGNASASTLNAANVCVAAELGKVIQGGATALSGYTIGGTGDCSTTADTVSCTVTSTSATTPATATVYCAR